MLGKPTFLRKWSATGDHFRLITGVCRHTCKVPIDFQTYHFDCGIYNSVAIYMYHKTRFELFKLHWPTIFFLYYNLVSSKIFCEKESSYEDRPSIRTVWWADSILVLPYLALKMGWNILCQCVIKCNIEVLCCVLVFWAKFANFGNLQTSPWHYVNLLVVAIWRS